MPKTKKKIEPPKANKETARPRAEADPQVVLQKALNNLKTAYRLLWHDMKRFGVTQKMLAKKMGALAFDFDIDKHPLVQRSQAYGELAQSFLNEFLFTQQKMVQQFGVEIPFDDVADDIETIAACHASLPLKAWRNVFELHEARHETNAKLKAAARANALKLNQALLGYVVKSERALASFAAKRAEQPERTQKMLAALAAIKAELKKAKHAHFSSLKK